MYEQDIHLEIKDVTFISHSYNSYNFDIQLDAGDRDDGEKLTERIKKLIVSNADLIQEIQEIKEDPYTVGLDELGEELSGKVEMLRRENARLSELIQRNKQQTPSKQESMRESLRQSMRPSLNTPRKHKKQLSKHTIEKSNTRMMRMSSNSILDQIDNNFNLEKVQTSTCQNYPVTCMKKQQQCGENEEQIKKIRPLNQIQARIKNGLKTKANIQSAKQKMLNGQLKSTINQQKVQQPSTSIPNEQVQRLHQYKQKLIKRLRSTAIKQQQLKKILSQLDKLYTGSLQRYQQLQKILSQLISNRQTIDTNQADIIERYQQVLRLQQILFKINKQYQHIKKSSQVQDQQQLIRLKTIKRELVSIINKLKLKCDIAGLSIPESIQLMSMQILNNVYLPSSRSMSNIQAKVNRIKQLCEQQKENNSKIISELKNKEQQLGKELLERQMKKSKKLA